MELDSYEALGKRLMDTRLSLATAFALRGLETPEAGAVLAHALYDPSVLLAHEAAYCLGQMRLTSAVPELCAALATTSLDPMVRHEAAEALGAIGGTAALQALHAHAGDPVAEVRDTCVIALQLLGWKAAHEERGEANAAHPVYQSVDPAPPLDPADKVELTVAALRARLLDHSASLFERYRAMFALRNDGSDEAVAALCEALEDEESGAVFTHEVAYVLGQLQHKGAVHALQRALEDARLHAMVRHEAAEALGSIADTATVALLGQYCSDPVAPVKESCEVALDILAYETSDDLHYADQVAV